MIKKIMAAAMLLFCGFTQAAEQQEGLIYHPTVMAHWAKIVPDLMKAGYSDGIDVDLKGLIWYFCGSFPEGKAAPETCSDQERLTKYVEVRNKLAPRITVQQLTEMRGLKMAFTHAVTDRLLTRNGESTSPAAVSYPVATSASAATSVALSDQVAKELATLGQRIDVVKQDANTLATAARKDAQEAASAATVALAQTKTASGLTAKAVLAAEASASAAKASATDLATARAAAKNSEQNARASADNAAKAENVVGRVSAEEEKTSWIIGLGLALVAALIWFIWRSKQKLKQEIVKVKAETIEAVQAAAIGAVEVATTTALAPVIDDIKIIKDALGMRKIVWPEDFALSVRRLGAGSPSYSCVIQIEGIDQPVPITVTYGGKPGYTKVKGVPGHDENEVVKTDNLKKSKVWTGEQLLIYTAARQNRFEVLQPLQAAA